MTKLLFVGDIHLGRVPWRLDGEGLAPGRLGPAEAWRRTVDLALERRVDAVVLAGDVVDQDRDRFEAYGHLERGVRRLDGAGIQVLGVCGNHDHVALPRLAARIAGFHLLGAGGRWERRAVGQADLLGWSFPQRHHTGDPLRAPGLQEALDGRRDGAALLGVLHADLDAPGSSHAPTRRQGLADLPVHRWFLGHIHRPDDLGSATACGYLGSLVGLDRGEQGPHGPWLVTVEGPGRITVEQIPLGPIQWLTVPVDVTGLPLGETADDELHQALEQTLRRARAADPDLTSHRLDAVGCVVRWTGRCSHPSALARFAALAREGGHSFHLAEQTWVVVDFVDATRPTLDLDAIAREVTPAGTVAALLLRLDEQGEAAVPEGVRRRYIAMNPADWVGDPDAAGPPGLLDLTRRAALQTLDALLDQRRVRGGA